MPGKFAYGASLILLLLLMPCLAFAQENQTDAPPVVMAESETIYVLLFIIFILVMTLLGAFWIIDRQRHGLESSFPGTAQHIIQSTLEILRLFARQTPMRLDDQAIMLLEGLSAYGIQEQGVMTKLPAQGLPLSREIIADKIEGRLRLLATRDPHKFDRPGDSLLQGQLQLLALFRIAPWQPSTLLNLVNAQMPGAFTIRQHKLVGIDLSFYNADELFAKSKNVLTHYLYHVGMLDTPFSGKVAPDTSVAIDKENA